MKIGLISDIHSNWEALNVVLKRLQDEEGVDEVFCGGDIVGYGPEPNKCVKLLSDSSVVPVRGNHDAGLTGELDLDFFNQEGLEAINWTRKKISKQNRKFLENLTNTRYFPRRGISLVHGSSVAPLTHYILNKVDALRSFRVCPHDIFLQICGHTHIPGVYELDGEYVQKHTDLSPGEFILDKDKAYILNPGSVGQPRDGNWKTSFAILELNQNRERSKVRFFREEYPAEKTRQKILDAGLPKELGDRLLEGR